MIKEETEMSLLEEYNRDVVQDESISKDIVFAIINGLLGRKGFDNIWDEVLSEDKEEILSESVEYVDLIFDKYWPIEPR